MFYRVTPDEMNIDGRIVPGYQAAAANVAKQLPLIEREFPPVAGCHPGTMNVLLLSPLRIVDPDFTTSLIQWEQNTHEKFDLTEIELECPIGGWRYKAWIYDPRHSPHRFNDYVVEIISRPIKGANYGVQCRIHLPRYRAIFGIVIV